MATVQQPRDSAALTQTDQVNPRLQSLLGTLEGLWTSLDELFGSLKPADWARRHGPDWTFADVPYHLTYFDHDVVARGIERGANVPDDEQRVMRTMRELNEWNAAKFAERRAGQSAEQSLQQMRAARDAVRRAVGLLTDAELDRPVFVPLIGCGWLTAEVAIQACISHSWSHATELRLRLKRPGPLPSAAATRTALSFYTGLQPMMMNREAAQKIRLTAVMEFTGPGGGAWTVRVASGRADVTEGYASDADLVISQRPDTFVKTMTRMHNPMLALLTRKMKVRGLRRMGAFGKVFSEPNLDTVIEPTGGPPPSIA